MAITGHSRRRGLGRSGGGSSDRVRLPAASGANPNAHPGANSGADPGANSGAHPGANPNAHPGSVTSKPRTDLGREAGSPATIYRALNSRAAGRRDPRSSAAHPGSAPRRPAGVGPVVTLIVMAVALAATTASLAVPASAATGSPTSAASTRPKSTSTTVPRDDQDPVDEANTTLGAALISMKVAQARLAADDKVVEADEGAVTAEIRIRAGDQAAHARAAQAYTRAATALRADQRRLGAIAIALYVGPPNALPVGSPRDSAVAADTPLLQKTRDAEESLAIAESVTGSNIGPAVDRAARSRRYEAGLAAKIRFDTEVLGVDLARVKAAQKIVRTAQSKVREAQTTLGSDRAVLATTMSDTTSTSTTPPLSTSTDTVDHPRPGAPG